MTQPTNLEDMMRQELERREQLEKRRIELEAHRDDLLRQVRERDERERMKIETEKKNAVKVEWKFSITGIYIGTFD